VEEGKERPFILALLRTQSDLGRARAARPLANGRGQPASEQEQEQEQEQAPNEYERPGIVRKKEGKTRVCFLYEENIVKVVTRFEHLLIVANMASAPR